MAFLLGLIQQKSGFPSGLLLSLVKEHKNGLTLTLQRKNTCCKTLAAAWSWWMGERRKDPCWFKLAYV